MSCYRFTKREREVILSLADHDLCVTAVARSTHCHYNTIVYHAKKIEDHTGLNPTKFYDMIALLELVKKQKEDI